LYYGPKDNSFEGQKMPDVWFDVNQVWEVSTVELTVSPIYTVAVGLVHPEKGTALRFSRLVRVREDKKPEIKGAHNF
jgi:DNA ligase-1